MEHWEQLFGNRIFDIEYENTINNLEHTARNLIKYCGLEWDDQCIRYYNTNRDVITVSQWQVRQPVYRTSLERWKQYEKHIGVLKEILAGTF